MHKHQLLFATLQKSVIVQSVTDAFDKLNHGHFKGTFLSSMDVSKQVICGLFHELIVHEISRIDGWRAGKQKVEADLVHESGLQVQVKTSSSPDGIAGNRYASENIYNHPSEFYLCVNFLPFTAVCKIRAGFIPADSWKPQRGKGNASTIKKEVLDALPFLRGSYLNHLPFHAITGIGEKLSRSLSEKGFHRLNDIQTTLDWETVQTIVKKEKTSSAIQALLTFDYSFFTKEGTYEKNMSVLRV